MSGISVAVIGAGAAGLCAARHLIPLSSVRTTVFEQASCVGGTWVYTDNVGQNEHGQPIHSSMYKNLRTNLPKEVMAFPDYPFQNSSGESFLHHSDVLRYLEDYKKHFDIEKFIKYNMRISDVRPRISDGSTKWEVTANCLKTQQKEISSFDYIMICNGHYSIPIVPDIPDISKYSGTFIHSHDYRSPEKFDQKSVLILGGGASGTDICVELSKHAKHVYLSHNNPFLTTDLPVNVSQVKGVESCIGFDSFSLTDGSQIQCDAVILATGYEYNFPFLSDSCEITVTKRRVSPLYKHFINIEHPSMCFIGIPVQICPFPQFDLQIRYFVKMIAGKLQLPSKLEMYDDLEREVNWRLNELRMSEKHLHKMGTLQWTYNKEIAELGNLVPIPQGVENLYNAVWERRRTNLPDYKKDSYSMIDSEHFSGNIFIPETGTYKNI